MIIQFLDMLPFVLAFIYYDDINLLEESMMPSIQSNVILAVLLQNASIIDFKDRLTFVA